MEKVQLAKKTAHYSIDGDEAKKLIAHGLPVKFEALSIGDSRGQVAIIPLDESNLENAERIVRLWNSDIEKSSLESTDERIVKLKAAIQKMLNGIDFAIDDNYSRKTANNRLKECRKEAIKILLG